MLRRVVLWLLLLAAVWYAASHLAEVRALAETLRRAVWWLILPAALLQVLYYAAYVWTWWAAFRAVGGPRQYRELFAPVIGSLFVNVVTPSAGLAGPALVIDDSVRAGVPGAQATAGVALAQAADFGGFSVILAAGLAYLAAVGRLTALETAAAAVLFAIILGIAAAFVATLLRPGILRGPLRWARRSAAAVWRLFRRPSPLDEGWEDATAEEFSTAASTVARTPGGAVRALAISLLGHTTDFASLLLIGAALGWSSPGSLLAAYAVGVLFWIVSPIPSGIGIVEGAMTVVLASFGAPLAVAAAITVAFRGLSFWIPLALGFVLLRRSRSFRVERTAESDRGVALLAAGMTFALGVIGIAAAIVPNLPYRLERIEPYIPFSLVASHLTSAISGMALIVLSRGLLRRKRAAWYLALAMLAVTVTAHLAAGIGWREPLLAGVFAVWLAAHRSVFHARSDPPSTRRALGVLAGAFLLTVAYGTAGFYFLDRHFKYNFGFSDAVRQTIDMFVYFKDPGLEPITGFGRYFADSIYVVAAVAFGYALLAMLSPLVVRGGAGREERGRALSIVEAWGRSSIARMALLPDKLFYFTPGGSVVSYVVRGGVAVALGDPIGPPRDLPVAIERFDAHAEANGWLTSFYQTQPSVSSEYRSAGFELLKIGEEAVVHLQEFDLSGKARKGLRSTVNHLEKEGYEAIVHEPPLSPYLIAELREVSDEWLTSVAGTEKRFSLGWFDPAYISEGPVIVVHDRFGRAEAFSNLVPEYRLNESTVDLMRHRPSAEKGVMDLLLVRLFEWARDKGYETFNLGLASLAGVGEEPKDAAVEKALHLVYEHLDQLYSFRGLHDYKQKFDPEWQPRFLAYHGLVQLPRVAAALVAADAGETNLLASYLPSLRHSLRGRTAPSA